MVRVLLNLISGAAALGLLACAAPTAEPLTIELTVTDPPAATRRVEVALGAEITLRITTPTDDRAHVHGYEIEQDLAAGVPTDIVFDATMAGTYEVESHVTDAVWLDLVVK
ncbi:hypothetical protein [Tessaracoccus sp. G1721]